MVKDPPLKLTEKKALLRCRAPGGIIYFIEKFLGVKTLEPFQIECLLEMERSKKVVIPACHDLGKTYMVACYLLWSLYCFEDTTVISTAPSFSMVKNLLWKEVRKLWKRAPQDLGGRLLDTAIEVDEEKWFATGISPKIETEEGGSNFQGYHNKYVRLIFDEASNINQQRWKSAKAMLTSANCSMIAIANPTNPSGEFKEACESDTWVRVNLSCFDSPNLKVNDIKNIRDLRKEGGRLRKLKPDALIKRLASYKVVQEELLTLSWVMEMWLEEGEESPFFQARVLGNFPKESSDSIVSYSQVEAAMIDPDDPLKPGPRIAGADVARFGSDSSVVYIVQGKRVIFKETINKRDLVYVANRFGWLIKEYKIQIFGVDDTGLSGVTDMLRRMVSDKEFSCKIIPFVASSRARRPSRYLNKRAESFHLLGKDIKNENIELQQDRKLLSQLPRIRYEYKKGLLKIEAKEIIKKRIGKSPDDSDALNIVNWVRNFGETEDLGQGADVEYGEVVDSGF